jgi:hypothetical protein
MNGRQTSHEMPGFTNGAIQERTGRDGRKRITKPLHCPCATPVALEGQDCPGPRFGPKHADRRSWRSVDQPCVITMPTDVEMSAGPLPQRTGTPYRLAGARNARKSPCSSARNQYCSPTPIEPSVMPRPVKQQTCAIKVIWRTNKKWTGASKFAEETVVISTGLLEWA